MLKYMLLAINNSSVEIGMPHSGSWFLRVVPGLIGILHSVFRVVPNLIGIHKDIGTFALEVSQISAFLQLTYS
jgi:hypothetical protein